MRQRWVILWGMAGLLACVSADAHIVTMRLGDFFMGALHPMTDPIDWLVWLACALLAARAGRLTARWLIVIVPIALALGLLLLNPLLTGRLSGVLDAVPLLAAGLLLAAGMRLRTGGVFVAVSILMVLRGAANAAGLRIGADLGLYAAGLAGAGYVAVTVLSAAVVIGVVDEAAPAWRKIAVRVLGSWLAAAGLMLIAVSLRG